MRTNEFFKTNQTASVKAILCIVIVFFTLISPLFAAAPQLISYQAALSDNLGDPLNATVNVTFKIWNAPIGGSAVWTETHTALTITDGKLSVLLGSITALDESVFSDSALYLGVTVGLDAEISPRSRMVSVPYAYRLQTIDGASGGNVSGAVQISEGSSPASLVVVGAGGDSVIIAPSDSFTIRATDPAGNATFSVSVGSLGTSVSLFDPVDSKDGLNVVPKKRVQITPEGILMFDSTGTDTSVALTATGDISGTGQIQMGAVPSSALATTVFGVNNNASGDTATISGGYNNTASADFATVGGGKLNTASGDSATVGGGGGNTASGDRATVGGGGGNTASGDRATVGGGYFNTASVYTSTVGGGYFNTASEAYATVGAGGGNTASGGVSTVGGGYLNTASGYTSTVGGGSTNTAGGVYSGVFSGLSNVAGNSPDDTGAFVGGGYNNSIIAKYATVGGGQSNTASGEHATVGGGQQNTANGYISTVGGGIGNYASNNYATIGGGHFDTASGHASTVPGGYANRAGDFSFAAGHRARAMHSGSFVWADNANNGTILNSSSANEFNIRSIGGVRIFTDSTLTAGVTMGAGASAWTAVSDKSVKKDFRSIDSDELLEKLSEIPISRWKYIAEESQADHIGPMSQDFYSAFGLGDDDKRISTIDADGVALAAIQALYKENQELKKRLDELETIVKQK